MRLTDSKIRNAKATGKPLKLTDGHGLYLEVRPTGSKLWRYRYRIAGKENLFALGAYPNVSLATARSERDVARTLVKNGIHPAQKRQLDQLAAQHENSNTFEIVAREWMAKKECNWSPYYKQQVERIFSANVFPKIGALPIRTVTAAHLLEIMKNTEERGAPTTAALIRQWASATFRYAVSTLRADSDPAAALKGAVQLAKTRHARPLSRSEVADLLQRLDHYKGQRTTVIALKLLLLTFVRTKELRMAEWSEFDFEKAQWRIPAHRMKMRDPHIVPLSRQTIDLLQELQQLSGQQNFLFPNCRSPGTCMTATTLNRALERMGLAGSSGIGFSAHGFRATASTILNEIGVRADVIEKQLAHMERNKVRASYNQAVYLNEREEMMQTWADLALSGAKHQN